MGVPVKVTSKRGVKTRRMIIDNARRIFFERGFRDVSVEELCKIIGISKVTFYRYFENRDELAETVFDELYAEVFPIIDAILNSDNSIEEVLETYYVVAIEFASSKISIQMMADIEILMPQKYETLRKYEFDQMIKLLKRGQDEGLVRQSIDPEVVIRLIEELFGSVYKHSFLIANNFTVNQVGSTIKDIMLYGLLGQKKQ
jgi:AcrR family transcriptional regulator